MRLASLKAATAGIICTLCLHAGHSFSDAESVTDVFSGRAEVCYASRGHVLEGAACGQQFTLGSSYAIRIFSSSPTKATEDMILKACSSGCMHAVMSELYASFRNDTICSTSTSADVGPVLVPLSDATCTEGSPGEGGPSEGSSLCLMQVTEVLRIRGILDDLVRMDGSFVWPKRYKMMAICRALQQTGCCALTFQRAATAFFISSCSIPEALQIGMLSQLCSGLEYDPYTGSVLAETEQRCRGRTAAAFQSAIKADTGQGCWLDACTFIDHVVHAAAHLGIRNAEALTYVFMLVITFSLLCVCVCSTCFVSWVMHRFDAARRKALLTSPAPEKQINDEMPCIRSDSEKQLVKEHCGELMQREEDNASQKIKSVSAKHIDCIRGTNETVRN